MSAVASKATMDPECSTHLDVIFRYSQMEGAALYRHILTGDAMSDATS